MKNNNTNITKNKNGLVYFKQLKYKLPKNKSNENGKN